MTDAAQDAPVATIEGSPRLMGSRCTMCATHTFPRQGACPRCGAATEAVALPTTGSLWSWTVQRIEPKPPYKPPPNAPAVYEPFAVGYIDLGPIRVESTLGGRPVDAWRIDDPVSLVVDDLDDTGHSFTFHFEVSAS